MVVCLEGCRNRGAKINPQDTRSALHFRMADKQQHLVTFWCSYGGFNPPLRAPCTMLVAPADRSMMYAGTQMGLFLQASQDPCAKTLLHVEVL